MLLLQFARERLVPKPSWPVQHNQVFLSIFSDAARYAEALTWYLAFSLFRGCVLSYKLEFLFFASTTTAYINGLSVSLVFLATLPLSGVDN